MEEFDYDTKVFGGAIFTLCLASLIFVIVTISIFFNPVRYQSSYPDELTVDNYSDFFTATQGNGFGGANLMTYEVIFGLKELDKYILKNVQLDFYFRAGSVQSATKSVSLSSFLGDGWETYIEVDESGSHVGMPTYIRWEIVISKISGKIEYFEKPRVLI